MTALLDRLGIALPILQAPMAGVQDEALAIAASQAGALGAVPCAMLDADGLVRALDRLAAAGCEANLNVFCHAMPAPDAARERRWREALAPYYAEAGIEPPPPSNDGVRRPIDADLVDLLATRPPRVMSFHFGLPAADLLRRIRGWGTLVLASATTVEEGRWLAAHGADVVIAQGIEAGGHRGDFLPGSVLAAQPSTRDLVSALRATLACPIVAAGGVAAADDVVALLHAGADAVQVGTAYLRCPEATTSAVHRRALQQARGDDTALTNLFSGRAARGLVNRLMRELGPLSDLPPVFPWASQALAPLRRHAEAQGHGDFSPLWCGTRPDAARDETAASVTQRLARRL